MESSVRRFGREILKLMAQLYLIETAKENWNKSRHGYRLAKILMTLLWELNSCIRGKWSQPQAYTCHRDRSLKCLLVVRQFPPAVGDSNLPCLC